MNWKKKLTTFTVITTLATGLIYLINRIIYFFTTIDDLLNVNEGSYFEWRFGNIFYTKHGEGSPILLIHDLKTYSSGHEFHKIVNELSKTNTVYCLDLLGCGRSDKPNLTYTNFLYVQLVTDFIKQVIREKTDIITSGESISIACMTTLYNNDIVKRILVSNPVDINQLSSAPTKKTKILKFIINIPILGTLLFNLLNKRSNIELLFLDDFYYNHNLFSEKDVKIYYESSHKDFSKSKYLFASIKGRYTNTNIVQSLKSVDTSIYIIASTGTPNYLTIAEQYKKYMPSIEIVTIDKAKTMPQLEKPEEYLEQVKILFDID